MRATRAERNHPVTQRYLRIAGLALFLTLHVRPAAAHDATEALRACTLEPDDARRLACYDREMARLTSAATTESTDAAPSTTPEPPPAPELSAEERFGLPEEEIRKKQKVVEGEKLDRLTATITGISQRPHGELVMTLHNGQVWVQNETRTFDVRIGDAVTIKTAALGSFLMVTASGRSTRVSRVL